MIKNKGFTLIELLIVITIMAILAGAAVPYVQDYIDDARIAKAKSDLNELRNAIMRYEVEKGKLFDPVGEGLALDNWQSLLVGPYLANTVVDPWGRPYKFSHAGSCVLSGAEDGDFNTNVISMDVRPAYGPTRAWWYDVNRSGRVDQDDYIDIKMTRPVTWCFIKHVFYGNSDTGFVKGEGNGCDLATDGTFGHKPHPKGLNWLRVLINDQPNLKPSLKVGCQIYITNESYDTSLAMWNEKSGYYTGYEIEAENIYDNAINPKPAKGNLCNPNMKVTLKAAQ